MKKICKLWKKEKQKDKKNGNKEKKNASSVKIEEVNTLSEAKEGDILFTSTVDSVHLMVIDKGVVNDWVLDSGASFLVTPNCECFTTYDACQRGQV